MSFETAPYFTKHHCKQAEFTSRTKVKTENKTKQRWSTTLEIKASIRKWNKNKQTRYLIVAIFHTCNSSSDLGLTCIRKQAQIPMQAFVHVLLTYHGQSKHTHKQAKYSRKLMCRVLSEDVIIFLIFYFAPHFEVMAKSGGKYLPP